MLPVIILDRDGVINADSPYYIKSVDEFAFLPGSVEAIARLTKVGYRLGIATNQSGLARGYYDVATLTAIHETMCRDIEAAGGKISEIVYCPHKPDAGCACRKPQPGMLLALAEKFNCQTKDFIFIGDKATDIQAAEAVGATPMLVRSVMTDEGLLRTKPSVDVFNSLAECTEAILQRGSA